MENILKLKETRKKAGLTQAQVANMVGISQNNYSYWENGKVKIDNLSLQRLSEIFGVSVDYLLGRTETKKAPAKLDEVPLNDLYSIPLLGRVVAGVPLESQENLEGYIQIGYTPPSEYFALRVQGDSMINAGIRDNSILVVHKQSYAQNGDVVVALVNGEATVKRFKVYGENIFLMPENPTFDPIPISKGSDFLILGKVVEVRLTL